jgi:hypothetical protein
MPLPDLLLLCLRKDHVGRSDVDLGRMLGSMADVMGHFDPCCRATSTVASYLTSNILSLRSSLHYLFLFLSDLSP